MRSILNDAKENVGKLARYFLSRQLCAALGHSQLSVVGAQIRW